MRLCRLVVVMSAVAAMGGCGSGSKGGGSSGKGGASGSDGRGGTGGSAGASGSGGSAGASGSGGSAGAAGAGGSAGAAGAGGSAGASGAGGAAGVGVGGASGTGASAGAAGGASGSGGSAGASGAGGAAGIGGGGASGAGGGVCATVTTSLAPVPATMLVLADHSPSMTGSKWSATSQAIVQALDGDLFDPLSLGLLASPSGPIAGPACVLGLPVACGTPSLPQAALAPAAAQKSSAPTGVRHDIATWLAANLPDTSTGADGTPLYAAIQSSLAALKASTVSGKRVLVVISDGSIDCADGSGRPAYVDCNGCNNWEQPGNIVTLLSNANTDPQKPIDSFVIGLPGSDTFDGAGCNFAPYQMRLALSAIAYAGSPGNADPACTGQTFTKTGPAPTVPCHVDLTSGFNAQALANAISTIRQKALGCVYDLPAGNIDRDRVNVQIEREGTISHLLRRSSPTDTCATGCWDYDANGRIAILGGACSDLGSTAGARVESVAGCLTNFKL
jgi:hypothetical protein